MGSTQYVFARVCCFPSDTLEAAAARWRGGSDREKDWCPALSAQSPGEEGWRLRRVRSRGTLGPGVQPLACASPPEALPREWEGGMVSRPPGWGHRPARPPPALLPGPWGPPLLPALSPGLAAPSSRRSAVPGSPVSPRGRAPGRSYQILKSPCWHIMVTQIGDFRSIL